MFLNIPQVSLVSGYNGVLMSGLSAIPNDFHLIFTVSSMCGDILSVKGILHTQLCMRPL